MAPVTALSSLGPDSSSSCPPWVTVLPAEGPGWPREVPTCLVHHRGEGRLDGCLAPLCRPDVMVRPILGRSQHLKELHREHSFNADVLEGNAGW